MVSFVVVTAQGSKVCVKGLTSHYDWALRLFNSLRFHYGMRKMVLVVPSGAKCFTDATMGIKVDLETAVLDNIRIFSEENLRA